MKWKLLSALLGLCLAQAALATIPLYQNNDVVDYEVFFNLISPNPPPTIDAKAFDNENVFTVGYANYTPYPVLFQTWNTLNYTNVGTMIGNSPWITNGAFIGPFALGSFGSGYQFDLHTTNQISHAMAGTVYNPGVIRCDSIQDGNNTFTIDFGGGLVFNFYEVTSLGQFKASATNVIIPGSIDVGTGGLIQLGGKKVDLTGGSLTVEALLNSLAFFGPVNFFNVFSTVPINSFGTVGVNTNFLWDPFGNLTANRAVSSYSPFPNILSLSNSTAYIQPDEQDPFNPGVTVRRAVFLVNNSPDGNVSANVYFDPLISFSPFGLPDPGCVNIGWSANNLDPATGSPVNSFLYLTDDYIWGASTNVFVIPGFPANNGVPDNFILTQTTSQVLFGPATSGFVNEFPNIAISNYYAYFNGNLTASTVNTNASIANPSGNVTNLPGAIKITASDELNLASSVISGANYLSLNSPHQFDGSPGAAIMAPFSDINLGVTNGFMTVSNVLMAQIPNYSGNLQAWSTRFITVDLFGVTNDYRILLVYSALEPGTAPWIQNLYLHGTNTLTVSDHLNVYGSWFSDATSLTLNTNLIGVGATSLDGEITWLNPMPFNANSATGTQQMPNLLWLTNNGAIRVLNTANFGNAATPQFTLTPAMPPIPASGTLSEMFPAANAVNKDQVTIGTNQYVFVSILTNATPNRVKIGVNFDASMNNLIAAIDGLAGAGALYSTATKSNKQVSAGALASHAFTVTAFTLNAAAGNAIATTTTSPNLSWSGHPNLYGGVDTITNYTSFVNNSLIADQGTAIWTTYFQNSGTVSNGPGSFVLQSGSAVLTNGNLVAGGDVVLVATNKPGSGINSLVISNHMIQAGRKLTLWSTNISDTGVTNGNIWVVGALSGGGTVDSGFNIPVMPPVGAGDLLGTTVTNIAPASKSIYNVWAGTNYGISTRGYSNNLALGQLILDAKGTSLGGCYFNFNGVGTNNALYVDSLQLLDFATQGNATNNYNFPWLKIGTNMTIYFAQALKNGVSVAEAIDNASRQGANGGRLRWVYSYAGYFSSTNIVYPDGSTNTFNTALAQSSDTDSDGDGIVNSLDPTPFFVPSEVHFTVTTTNLPPLSARIEWTTIPNATNFVYYKTNLFAANWLAFTNFKNFYYGNNVAVTNAAHSNYFNSPQTYIMSLSAADNSQTTNVWVYDVITNTPHYYKVVIWPWLNFPH